MTEKFDDGSYDKNADMMPEVSDEVKKEITAHAVMDAEVYLANLHFQNPKEEPREPRENEVANYIRIYNDFRVKNNQNQLTDPEMEIYDLTFRSRFSKGYKESEVN